MYLTFEKIKDIRSRLKAIFLSQNEATDIVLDTFLLNTDLIDKEISKPNLFYLLGDQNSFSLFFAKQIAKEMLFDFQIFSMNEYQMEDDVFEIQLRYSDDGKLIPLVVFISNIEDAHLNIQLQLARIVRQCDFESTIFFITSKIADSFLLRGEVNISQTSSLVGYLNLICDFLRTLKKNTNGEEVNMFSSSFLDHLSSLATIVIFNQINDNTFLRLSLEYFMSQIQSFEKKYGFDFKSEQFYEFSSLLFLSFAPFYDLNRIFEKISYDLLRIIIHQKSLGIFNTIILQVDQFSLNFLNLAQENLKYFMTQISRQKNRIELEWNINCNDGLLKISIVNVIKLESAYRFIKSTEYPEVEYSGISFTSIAGHESVKVALKGYIDLLQSSVSFIKFGINPPKGLIFHGNPGVGKSSLAEAFCFETKNPYLRLVGTDLFNQDLIYRTYLKALESSPCIIILEDIDVKGSSPLSLTSLSANYIVRCIKLTNIFTIVTSGSLEDIPSEFLSPGVLDIIVEVNDVDKDARKFFLDKIIELPHDKNINFDQVASLITGMNRQELQRIVPQAVLSAIYQKTTLITESILIEQINKIKYGERLELKRLRNPHEEMELAAFHEAGHAVMSCVLLPQLPIEQVTVSPRSDVLGFVSYKNEDFISTATKDEIFKNICILLAGRTVKAKQFGSNSIDSGDIADLGQATYEAYVAIAHLGMDDHLGYINIQFLEESSSNNFLKEKIEARFLFWLDKAKKETELLVDDYWHVITYVAKLLIQKQVISGDELIKIIKNIQDK